MLLCVEREDKFAWDEMYIFNQISASEKINTKTEILIYQKRSGTVLRTNTKSMAEEKVAVYT